MDAASIGVDNTSIFGVPINLAMGRSSLDCTLLPIGNSNAPVMGCGMQYQDKLNATGLEVLRGAEASILRSQINQFSEELKMSSENSSFMLREGCDRLTGSNDLDFGVNVFAEDWRTNSSPISNSQFPIPTKGIVFIDANVEDSATLLSGIEAGYEVVRIDSGKDPIAQITQTLALKSDISSLHIIAHGAAGSLQLGSASIDSDTLDASSQQLQTWATALTPDADILLYSCDVAFGQTGKAFVQKLAQLTSADIAASDDKTGSAAQRGDWEFEVQTGKIEAKLAFASATIATYDRILPVTFDRTDIVAGGGPISIATGNFNADTFPDLVVVNENSNNVSILLGNGTGGFSAAPTPTVAVGTTPLSVVAGNFNADTFPDLAVANSGSDNSVSILLGNGTGGFSAAPTPTVTVGTNPRFVTAGNFNADTFPDLAVANSGSNSVSILLGNGTGGFSAVPTPTVTVGTRPRSIVVGNFNADTFPDLAVVNESSNNVSILLGNGTGGFSAAPTPTVGVGSNPISAAAGNFNADTFLDLAVANALDGNVSILLGNGAGGFSAAPTPTVIVGTFPFSIAAGNFNGDTLPDLAVANLVSSNVSILLGVGGGNFSAATNFNVGGSANFVAASNFNADTLSDLAVTNPNGVSILLNTTTTVSINATNPSLTETTSNSGTYRITRNTTAGNLTVNLNLDAVSSAVAADYTLSPNITVTGTTATVVIPNGQSSVDVTFTPVDDTLPEAAETLKLNIAPAATYEIDGVNNTATIAIAANDAVSYAVATNNSAIAEGNTGTQAVTFTVTRSGGTGAASSVDYAITGSATNTADYNNITVGGTAAGASGTVNFAVGETSKTITLDVLGDTANELDENIVVTLSNATPAAPLSAITTATASTTITDDDSVKVNFGAATYSNIEGSSDTTVTIPVTLSGTPAQNVTVPIDLSGSATGAGNDYTISSATLNFAAGTTTLTQNLVITIKPDDLPENDETVILSFGTIAGAVAGSAIPTATLTIAANDAVSYAVAATNNAIAEGNTGSQAVTFTVTRSGGIGAASSVDYAITGSATNTSDYNNIRVNSAAVGASGTANFAVGETSKTITLDVLGDAAIESNENIIVTLSNATPGAPLYAITTATATTIINNDDSNSAPTLASAIASQNAIIGTPFTYQFSANTFNDPDPGDTLTYTATLANGNPFPAWLNFNNSDRTFSGTPASGDAGNISIRLVATDTASASVSTTFALAISPSPTPSPAPSPTPSPTPSPSLGSAAGIFNAADSGGTSGVYAVGGTSGETVSLQFDWSFREAAFNNEVGFFLVDDDAGRVNGVAPSDRNFALTALSSAGRQVLFGSGTGAGPGVDINLKGGDRLMFYLIQNSTAVNWLATNSQNNPNGGSVAFFSVTGANSDSFNHVRERASGTGSLQLSWEDLTGGGDSDFNDVVLSVGPAAIKIPGTAGQTTPTTVSITGRDAVFNNEVGLFYVNDANGKIGNLSPGDRGYANAAFADGNFTVLLASGQSAGAETTVSLASDRFIGFYLIQNSTAAQFRSQNSGNLPQNDPKAFFSFIAASADRVDHFWRLPGDEFAFEDLLGAGDRDFNDLQFRLRFRA